MHQVSNRIIKSYSMHATFTVQTAGQAQSVTIQPCVKLWLTLSYNLLHHKHVYNKSWSNTHSSISIWG